MKKTYIKLLITITLMFIPIQISANTSVVPTSQPVAYKYIELDNVPKIYGEISSRYGYRKHPITGKARKHNGVDLVAKIGTNIYSSGSGIVIFSGWRIGYGNVVKIDHENGFVVSFSHNSKNLVNKGDRVNKTTLIAKSGSTGFVTGPHLHVEVEYNNININPEPFVVQKD